MAENAARTMQRTPEERKALLNRLGRIEGQIRGLAKMVDQDLCCGEILVQASAADAALRAFSRQLLAAHVRTCVARDLKNGREEAADELLDVLHTMLR